MTQEEINEKRFRPAGFVVRAVALLIDLLIIALAQVPPLLWLWTIDWNTPWSLPFVLVFFAFAALYAVLSSLVPFWLYTSWYERSNMHGTPGKYLMELEVVDVKDNYITFGKSTLRLTIQYAVVGVATMVAALVIIFVIPAFRPDFVPGRYLNFVDIVFIIYGLCLLPCLFTKHRQTLFDLMTGRRVIKAPKSDADANVNARVTARAGVDDAGDGDGDGDLNAQNQLAEEVGLRIKSCAQFAWAELPTFRAKLPINAFYAACAGLILFNFGWVLSQINQVHSIESKIEDSGGKLPLLSALDKLHIKPRSARHSYQSVEALFGTFLDKKTLRTYDERANEIECDYISVYRLAKLDAAENNPDKAAQLMYDWGATRTEAMDERGKAFADASTFATDKTKKLNLLRLAMAYAPCDIDVLKDKLKADKELNDTEQAKVDQQQLEYANRGFHGGMKLEDVTGVRDNNIVHFSEDVADEILKRYPKNNLSLFSKAQSLALKDKDDEAEKIYAQVIENDPTDPLPYARRAYFYSHESKPQLDKALADIDKALSLAAQDSFWQQKISILKKKNDAAGVSAAITEASKLKPDVLKLAANAVYLCDHGYKNEATALLHSACDAYKTNIKTRIYIDDSNYLGMSPLLKDAIESLIEVANTCGTETDKAAIRELINTAIPDRERESLLNSAGQRR
jgi:uncharacterized RDD family membrane protein YckC